MARPYIGGTSAMVEKITASKTLTQSDSGKVYILNPDGATATVTLPAASGNAGWQVTVIVTEDDGGNMDQNCNISCTSGEFYYGIVTGADGGGGQTADNSSTDHINIKQNVAKSGEKFEIFSDGTYMHAVCHVYDATDSLFATTALS